MATTYTPIYNTLNGNDDADRPTISGDGNVVTFGSNPSAYAYYVAERQTVAVDTAKYVGTIAASGTYVGLTDGTSAYRKNLSTGSINLVSVTSGGASANLPSIVGQLSGDGSVATFFSDASNLGGPIDGKTYEAYVHSFTTGTTTLVSRTPGGDAAGADFAGKPGLTLPRGITTDGSRVLIESSSQNLDPRLTTSDANEIYVNNAAGTALQLVSVTQAGVVADGYNDFGTMSGDGNLVAFVSSADNIGLPGVAEGIFLKNLATGTLTLVSTTSAGVAASGFLGDPALSRDGRYLAF